MNNKRTILTITLILGIVFLLIGLFYQIPDRIIPYNYKEYVGGDAYNIMIEASIRSGEIAGAMIIKAIYIVFGVALLLISIYNLCKKETPQEQYTDSEQKNAQFTTNDL